MKWHNKIGRANRRPAFPLNAWRQFEIASCARASLSAAVAHLYRSADDAPVYVRTFLRNNCQNAARTQ